MTTKPQARRWARRQRAGLLASASARVCAALPPLLHGYPVVYVYAPDAARGELDLWPAWRTLAARGTALALPRAGPDRRLDFRRWQPGDALAPDARYGLLEPVPSAPAAPPPDAIVLPGLAAAPDGARVGYGGGYYDALVARFPQAHRVFPVAAACVADGLPRETHDAPVDLLVTDRFVLWTASRPRSSVQPMPPRSVRPSKPPA